MAKTFQRLARRKPAPSKISLPGLPVSEPAEYSSPKGVACPDLRYLAGPLGFPPAVIDPDSPFDQAVLGLALACNDLHDCLWVLRQTDKGRRKAPCLDGYDGGRMGLELWAMRVVAGVINEMLIAIHRNRAILTTHNDVIEIQSTMNPEGLGAWKKLLANTDEALMIDPEFTRPGVRAFLEDFARLMASSNGSFAFKWN